MSAHQRRLVYRAGTIVGGLVAVLALGAMLLRALPVDSLAPAIPPAPSASPQNGGPLPTGQPPRPGSPATPAVATPAAQATTVVVEYAPERPDGQALSGSCWTNSLAVPSSLAWRCNVGTQTLDPCFVLGEGEVVCNPNPLLGQAGVLVRLQEPLPEPDLIAEKTSSAWVLQLDDGDLCNLATGATGMVGDKRITYVCSPANPKEGETVVILGDPMPGPVWTAEKATLALRDGKLVTVTTAMALVRAAARGPAALVPYGCDGIADGLGVALGAEVRWAEVPFIDPVSGERGTACQASVQGAPAGPHGDPLERAGKLLVAWGWQEDARYRAHAAGQSATGFRQASALCLLSAAREAGQAAVDLNVSCVRERAAAAPEPAGQPQRITFAPGATADSLRGTLAAGEAKGFNLRAFAGQTMIVQVTSPGDDVYLAVVGDDRTPLLRPGANAQSWLGRLPSDQDYLIWVAARGEATPFTLDVTIPAELQLAADGQPVLVQGELKADQSVHYLLVGPTDEGVAVEVTLRGGVGYLVVSSLADGLVLVPAAEQAASWQGELAPGQDYIIEVFAADASTRYALEVATR